MKKSILFGALAFFAIGAMSTQTAEAQEPVKTKATTEEVTVKKDKNENAVQNAETAKAQKKDDCCKAKKDDKKADCCEKKAKTEKKGEMKVGQKKNDDATTKKMKRHEVKLEKNQAKAKENKDSK